MVRYEDFVKNPKAMSKECASFCELDSEDPRFQKGLESVKIVDANSKKFRIPSWRSNMRSEQVDIVLAIAGPELAHFGYV